MCSVSGVLEITVIIGVYESAHQIYTFSYTYIETSISVSLHTSYTSEGW